MQKQNSELPSKLPLPPDSSFENFGSSLHFKIKDYCDLEAVLELDEALWIATTAPISNLKIDPVFLSLLDADEDERLRAEEIKDGIRFLKNYLVDYSVILENNLRLPLTAINTETELGERIYSSARKVLSRLNVAPESVKLNQVRTVKKEVLEGGLDQAGIVLVAAAKTDSIFPSLRYQTTKSRTS